MTTKQLLISEVQTIPESLAEQVLDYLQYLKVKKNKVIMSEEIEKGGEKVDIVEQVAGVWKDRKFSVEKYIRKMRKNSRTERNSSHE